MIFSIFYNKIGQGTSHSTMTVRMNLDYIKIQICNNRSTNYP